MAPVDIEEITAGRPDFLAHARRMIQTHPAPPPFDTAALLTCIEACFDAVQACTSCADACLAELDPRPFLRCIRANQDCAEICETTARILSRQSAFRPSVARAIIQACSVACDACADECSKHEDHDHCRLCEEACRYCEEACNVLLQAA